MNNLPDKTRRLVLAIIKISFNNRSLHPLAFIQFFTVDEVK